MSTTTTSTTIYDLVSYRYQQDKPGMIRSSVPKEEWRIYRTNSPSPLRLYVETTRSSTGYCLSLVLRIIDNDATRPGGPVTLDQLDLLDFSKSKASKLTSPLKAVFGGKQVGFRYLHPLEAAQTVQYHKRFQLTLQNEKEAGTLVESIRHACPTTESRPSKEALAPSKAMVKPSASHAKNPASQMAAPPSLQQVASPRHAIPASTYSGISSPRAVPPNSATTAESHRTNARPLSARDSRMEVDPPVIPDVYHSPSFSSIQAPRSPPPSILRHPAFSDVQNVFTKAYSQNAAQATQASTPDAPSNQRMLPPTSSTFHQTSSGWPRQTPTPDHSSSHVSPLTPPPFVGASEPNVYKMSTPELEKLVARVLDEPGFAGLMERLDRMYTSKGLVPTLRHPSNS